MGLSCCQSGGPPSPEARNLRCWLDDQRGALADTALHKTRSRLAPQIANVIQVTTYEEVQSILDFGAKSRSVPRGCKGSVGASGFNEVCFVGLDRLPMTGHSGPS